MTDGTVPLSQLVDWLRRFAELVTDQRAYLTELDSAIGDADHGANMARGMTAVMEKVDGAAAPTAADELFKSVGMTLVTSVGGASGPLYGTFFLRMGMNAGPIANFNGAQLGSALRAGLEGVVTRGKAELGDKTMFDAMSPALDAYDEAIADNSSVPGATSAAFSAAEIGRDATIPLVVLNLSASYLGERSAGLLFPGVNYTFLLFQ
ncbi:MAG: dihydroxyacetone kinase subunit DhaL, partial [Actinomycetota bacterium]|nr:dihydroxyacetone kinase subunit DhaL [Actinomycetota bacterium]